MNKGVVLNLFEVTLPSAAIPVMSKPWENTKESLRDLRRDVLPALLYASEETSKLFVYGNTSVLLEKLGFMPDSFTPDQDPRFTGRILLDSIINYLTSKTDSEFDLQRRQYSAKIHEVTNFKHPLQRVESRLDIYPSYLVQTVFLRIGGQLKYFLLINPKARYRFVHSLAQISQNSKIDITGRFVRVACPKTCNIHECELHSFRGMLAGKFTALTNQSSFCCRFPDTRSTNSQFVQLDDRSRFNFAIPIEVCELEASTTNINAIFSQRFSPSKASTIISDLRVLTGDLLNTTPRPTINTEVGQRHWSDLLSLIQNLSGDIPVFDGPAIRISQEPVRVVEGGYTPEGIYFAEETEIEEEIENAIDDNAF